MYKVIAHRANTDGLLENSLAAIESCIRQGAPGIEIDIRHSSDQNPFLFHDEHFLRLATTHNRVTEKSPLIHQLSAADLLKNFKLRNGEDIPSLEASLDLMKDKDITVFLELKDKPSALTLKVIEEAFHARNENLRLISFDHEVLRKIKKENLFFSRVKMLALHEIPRTTWVPGRVEGLDGVNSNLFHPLHALYLKSLGLEVGIWWAADKLPPSIAKALFFYVDYLTTDNWKAFYKLN